MHPMSPPPGMQPVPLVRAVRSGVEESVHRGSVAVTDDAGRLVASAGDPRRICFARSAMKPLQAAVSLGVAGHDLSEEEIAVMAASHNGEPVHLATVHRLLERASLGPDALRCPPAYPLDAEAARAADGPAPRFHNCSGKHAGMLLACVRGGLDPARYVEPDHPLQVDVLSAVRRACDEAPRAVGVDGCGVPVHALSLRGLARLYTGFARGTAGLGEDRVVAAMRAQPYLVAGRDRLCTAVMEMADGVIVKVGAEGLVCAGAMGPGLGVAVKIEDGSSRALAPALLHTLRLLGVVDDALLGRLDRFVRPPVRGGGREVGALLPTFELTWA